ncbi:hypothetical protein DFJ74DRAFT_658828 [Hyaloraphidium curvatum]|nr:hypothetical protein DFJ74DRAFT_658828 [Hyaloraphidium curvatum]
MDDPNYVAGEEDDDLLEEAFASRTPAPAVPHPGPAVGANGRPSQKGAQTWDTGKTFFDFLSLPNEVIRHVLDFLLYSNTPRDLPSVPSPTVDSLDPSQLRKATPSLLYPLLLVSSGVHVHASDLLYSSVPTFISSSQDSLPNLTFQLTSPLVPRYRQDAYRLVRELDIGWAGEDWVYGPVWKRLLSSLPQLNKLAVRHSKTRSRARERHAEGGRDADSSAVLPAVLGGLAQAGCASLRELSLVGFSFEAANRTSLALLKAWCWRNRGRTDEPATQLAALTLISSRFALRDLVDLLTPPPGQPETPWLEKLVVEECTIDVDRAPPHVAGPPGPTDRLPKWSSSLTKRRRSNAEGPAIADKRWKLNPLAAPEAGDAEQSGEESFFYEAYAPGPYVPESASAMDEGAGTELAAEPAPHGDSTAISASAAPAPPANLSAAQRALAGANEAAELLASIFRVHSTTLNTFSFLHNGMALSPTYLPSLQLSASFPIRPILPFLAAESLPALRRLAVDLATCSATISVADLAAFFSGLSPLDYLHLQAVPGDKLWSLAALPRASTLVIQGSAQPSLDPLAQVPGLEKLYLLDCRDLLWEEGSLDSLCPVVAPGSEDERAGLAVLYLRLGLIHAHVSMDQGSWFTRILARGYVGGNEVRSAAGTLVGVRKRIEVKRVDRSRGPGAADCGEEARVRRPIVGRRAEDDF